MCLCFCLQGIEWTNIEYFNNAIICDLIENVSVTIVLKVLALIFTIRIKWGYLLEVQLKGGD